MRLGFLIIRTNHYRQLAPVVQAALDKGHEVFLYHLYDGKRFQGSKALQFPVLGQSPFQTGVHLRIVHHTRNFPNQAERDCIHAVVSLTPRIESEHWNQVSIPWFMLQTALDTFLAPNAARHFENDYSILRSKRWVNMYEGFSGNKGVANSRVLLAATPGLFEVRALPRDEILRKLDLPEGRYLTYLPIPAGIAGYLSGKAAQLWARLIFTGVRGDWRGGLVRGLLRNLFQKAELPDVTEKSLYLRIVELAAELGCRVLVKGRIGKEEMPDFYHEHSALVVYDETYWPSTVHELLRISDYCVSFRSMAQFEAAYLDCFMLNLILPGQGYSGQWKFFESAYKDVFACDGVSGLMTLQQFFKTTHADMMAQMTLDAKARERFLDDWDSGEGATASSGKIVGWIEQSAAS